MAGVDDGRSIFQSGAARTAITSARVGAANPNKRVSASRRRLSMLEQRNYGKF
jgi:hypothetical protein